jgi:hypothetical protein
MPIHLRQNTSVEVTFCSGWIELAEGLINFSRLIALSQQCVGHAQVMPSIGIFRLYAERLPIRMNGVGVLFKFVVGIAQAIPALRVIPLNAQRIPIGVDCVLVFLEISVGNAEFMPSLAIFSLVAYRFPIGMNPWLYCLRWAEATLIAIPRNRICRVMFDFLLGEF